MSMKMMNMMMNTKIGVSTLVLTMLIGVNAMAAQQTTCPLMGGKINRKTYADHDGKRVYFCCKDCVGKFKKDPAKYIKKLEGQGVTLETAPKPQMV